MPSPKTASNACYFYNKVDSDNQIFVSYHFEEDSSVNDHFADVHQTLAILRPVNIVWERSGAYDHEILVPIHVT